MATVTVIGIDPGGTIGWACYRMETMPIIDDGDDPEIYDEGWHCGQIDPGSDQVEQLELLIEMNHTAETVVVCERFIPRPDKKDAEETVTLQQIGAIELICRQREIELVLQMPAQAKGFVKDVNLKKLGMWFPGKKWRHAMDATRHVAFYLVNGPMKRRDLMQKGWKF